MRLANIARTALGIIYLLGAAINLRFAFLSPWIYREFASFAIIPFYKTLWNSAVIPHLQAWLILVVVFEIIIGIFILSKGNLVKIGLIAGITFNLFLIPFWWSGFALINLVLVSVQIFLLRGEYDSAVTGLLRSVNKKHNKFPKLDETSLSTKIYILLIITLAILSAFNVFLSQNYFLPVSPEQLPASKSVLALANAAIMLILYGGLGFLGLKLSRKLGFADIWDPKVSNKQRFLIPALVGVLIGIFFIIADTIFSLFHNMALPHPPFPTSLIASAIAGIGEEAIFRLFFISFWVWLISHVILKKRWQNQIFWIVAILSAIAFAFGHIPSVMILLGLNSLNEIPFVLIPHSADLYMIYFKI